MLKSFLAIGECMVELAQTGADSYRRGFAGDTFNTAWYARRLLPTDWNVGYLSAIGEDAVSQQMADFMAAQGIDTAPLRRVADRTVGLYMITTEAGERRFSYWRSQSAAQRLADNPDWLTRHLEGCGIAYFSGITLAILPPDRRKALCTALAGARAAGTLVAFDTNLRPRLWESEAAMRNGIVLGASVADVVLPSLDDEKLLHGSDAAEDAIARYRAAGARIVAAKNGAGRLTLWDEAGGLRQLAAHEVPGVVDTTAAGDSFGAAFLAGIASGQNVDAAAHEAMQLAAKVIQAPGALVPGILEGEST